MVIKRGGVSDWEVYRLRLDVRHRQQTKNSKRKMSPPGIEPTTLAFLADSLNHVH